MSNDRRFLESSPLSGCLVRLEPYEEAVKAQVRVALNRDPAAWNLFAMSGQGDHFESFWSNIEREVSAPSCSCSSTPFSGERDEWSWLRICATREVKPRLQSWVP
jgi:hypothetical protein